MRPRQILNIHATEVFLAGEIGRRLYPPSKLPQFLEAVKIANKGTWWGRRRKEIEAYTLVKGEWVLNRKPIDRPSFKAGRPWPVKQMSVPIALVDTVEKLIEENENEL